MAGTPLALAHIAAQERLRKLASTAIASIWRSLPAYDEANVDEWLSRAVPTTLAAQRQSVALTEAFLSAAVTRRPIGIDPAKIIGPGLRGGVEPAEVYRRPFVTVWSALQAGTEWDAAVAQGMARATSAAETDVQLAMRTTLRDVGQADDLIIGYQRVPDGGACDFCQLVSGQRYHSDDLMPIHNHCGCGVDVITAENRHQFAGKVANDRVITRGDGLSVEVREHGELGPVLTNADQHFTHL